MQSLRSQIHEYLTHYESFELFDRHHLVALGISAVLIIGVPWLAWRFLNPRHQAALGAAIGIVVMLNYPVWIALEALAGTFDVREHLPFHLCRFADLAVPWVMIRRRRGLYEVLYFWGFSGILQAAVTPSVMAEFPHFQFFRYWTAHAGLMVAPSYATIVYGLRPTPLSLLRSFAAMNLFLLVAAPVNLLLGANYFYICGKPATPSLLDWLGPWPWYIVAAEFVALAHFAVAYLPIYVWGRITRGTEDSQTMSQTAGSS